MDATDEDAISKLIQLYNSGQSLNLADGADFNVSGALPGAVPEILTAKSTNNSSVENFLLQQAEKERELNRTNDLLERQRANLKQQDSTVEKTESLQKSEVDMEAAKKSTSSIAAAISRCSKLMLGLNDNTDAAGDIASIENEECDDIQGSISHLSRIRRIATAAVQRARPIKKPPQPKRDVFISDVAEHLRSTTNAQTWSEWELDSNFEVFCQQVHAYEIEQSTARWLECEKRAWDHAKLLMEDGRSSTGSLSFNQARAILVEIFNIRIENNQLMFLSVSSDTSKSGSISKAQKLHETYKRMVGSLGNRNNHSERVVKRRSNKAAKAIKSGSNDADDEALRIQAEIKKASSETTFKQNAINYKQEQESDEQIAALTLQRTVNQGWKQRFADMMAFLDAKDAAKRKNEKDKFTKQYVRKAKAIYNLGSSEFVGVLRALAPAQLHGGCIVQLKRVWNRLFISGDVLAQLIKDCEYFALTHYCKKIQKQWRTMRIRRYFETVLNRSRYLASLAQQGKMWKAETDFPLSISGRVQMLGFRTSMKGQKAPGLMEWDQEFAQTGTLTAGLAEVSTLHNRMIQLKSRNSRDVSSVQTAGTDFFHELHPHAAKWSLQSQYYELVSSSAIKIQRFWKSVCKRRAFFASIRYAAAYCILRWMTAKIKGAVGHATGGLHALQVTAKYTQEAAHLAHLIYEKNSLRYQLEGTKLIQCRRKFLENELQILKSIQEYQTKARLRVAKGAMGVSSGLRMDAIQTKAKADENLNKMLRAEEIRRVPRPVIPEECVSQPVGPVVDGNQVFLLQNKKAARQHREYTRNLVLWKELQAGSAGQAGLPMEQKLAATALSMQMNAKGILLMESHDRYSSRADT